MNASNDMPDRLCVEPVLPDLKDYKRIDVDLQWFTFTNRTLQPKS